MFFRRIVKFLKNRLNLLKLRRQSPEAVFTDFYKNNGWAAVSRSGQGSDLTQTAVVAKLLPELFVQLNIKSMLDAPCGDFYWMQHVNLTGIDYTGGDIVQELVLSNTQQFGGQRQFIKLNLLSDKIPVVDLVFCRDCLVHLSHKNVHMALQNLKQSGAKYLLTTTFPSRSQNKDIITGNWHPLNLELAPFNFPKPLQIFNEKCTEENGMYADKSLGLWRISDL